MTETETRNKSYINRTENADSIETQDSIETENSTERLALTLCFPWEEFPWRYNYVLALSRLK